MKQVFKYFGYLLLLCAIGFLIWRFWFIIVWILVAAVLSFIGQPLVRFFDGLHIRRLRLPHTISTLFALTILVAVFLGVLAIFVPLIVSQAETISRIDLNQLAENLQEPLRWIEERMHEFGAIPDGQTLQDFIITKIRSVVNLGNITTLINNLIGTAGNMFLGVFSILFISFFFLKDENMFTEGLLLIVPVKHHKATLEVVDDSKNLLRRYFIGVILEVIGVMSLITIGLWIFGVENALLIGFFGGIMNIIPYLGPIIGALIALTLGMTATLATGIYSDLLPAFIRIAGVLLVVNFIDNNILVPLIYSKSVKSHPLEIFLIIIMGGSLAGLLGMLLAVPVYTVLRVIAREFFRQFRIVQKLTKSMNEDESTG
jgi:predicted PurR-regulated permease PerM